MDNKQNSIPASTLNEYLTIEEKSKTIFDDERAWSNSLWLACDELQGTPLGYGLNIDSIILKVEELSCGDVYIATENLASYQVDFIVRRAIALCGTARL